MKSPTAPRSKKPTQLSVEQSPPQKALRTAKWARIMTKWLISHSSKGGVKWQVVSFNGPAGQESTGIVDMIAIRKSHRPSATSVRRGDLFEIILIQVKGGTAKFPSREEIDRLVCVKDHHRADKVVLTEWKRGEKMCCYLHNQCSACSGDLWQCSKNQAPSSRGAGYNRQLTANSSPWQRLIKKCGPLLGTNGLTAK